MDTTLTQVLLIEDNPADALLLSEALEQDTRSAFEITNADHLKTALQLLTKKHFDVILLDLSLPDSQGLDTFIKFRKESPNIPVVILSGLMNEEIAFQAIHLGAQDYLVKGQEVWEIAARTIRYAIERQRARAALRESENRFRNLFEYAPVAYLSLDGNGFYLDFNSQLLELVGYAAAELMGHSFADQWSPEIQSSFSRKFARFIQDGEINADIQLVKKDGTLIEVLMEGKVQYDSDRQFVQTHSVLFDITTRKLAEQALRETQERFSAVFRSNPLGISITELADGTIVDANESFLSMFGFTRREILRRTPFELNIWQDPEEHTSNLKLLRAQGEAPNTESKLRKKDGETLYALASYRLIELNGKHYVLNMFNDITDRKQKEQAVIDNERRFLALIENGLENISLVTAAGVLLWESPAVVRTLDYEPNTFVGQNIMDLLHPDDREKIAGRLAELVHQPGTRLHDTFRLKHSDGSWRWVEAAATNLLEKPGIKALVINYHDITEHKQNELEVKVRTDEFAALYETTKDLSLELDVPKLLRQIVERTNSLLASSGGFIYLYDQTHNDLVLTVATELGVPIGTRLKMGEGMAGQVALTREPLIIENYQDWQNRAGVFADQPFRSIVEVPMLSGGELIGILGVEQYEDSTRKFTEKDAGLLSLFAGYAAGAVRNARLLNEADAHARQLSMLYEAGLVLNRELNPQNQLRLLFEMVQSALKADNAVFFRYQEAQRELYLESRFGESIDPTRLHELKFILGEERGLVGWVAQNGTPYYLADAQLDARWIDIGSDLHSVMWVPVGYEERLLGVLTVASKQVDAFSKQDQQHVVLFANQIAIAMENGHLFEALQRELAERKQVEETLRREQQRAQQYLDIAGIIMLALDENGRVTLVNQKACELLGYPHDEIIGKDWLNTFLPPAVRDELKEVFQQLIAGSKEPSYYENPVLTKSGEERLIAWRNILVRDHNGKIISTLSSGEDITERRQAEQALRKSEQRYKTLIDQTPAIVYIDDSSTDPGQTQFISPYIQTMLGFTPEEWIKGGEELWKNRLHPDDRDRVLAEYQHSIQTSEPLNLEYRIYTRDERVVWVHDQATTLRDNAGKPHSVHGVMHDITERKESQIEIDHQLSELEALYENGLTISRMLEPRQIARRIVQVLDQKMKWHHATVRILRPETGQLELVALSQPGLHEAQINEQITRVNQFNINLDYGLSGWVVKHRTPLRSANLKENPAYVETYPGIQSGLYVPVISGEDVIGSIAVESERENAFAERDERLLVTLANQAAISFINARLYARLQQELIERRRTEDQVLKLNVELEQRVQERTLEIETTHQRLELATASSGIGVWELKSGVDIFYWDERMHGLYGTLPDNFVPTFDNWLGLVHPDDRKAEAEKTNQAITQPGTYQSEFRIIRRDGAVRHINSHAIVLVDEQRNFKDMIGVHMDITTIKQAEETLRMANSELERALRMKDEFLANMSHELRTPLNAILGLSESLEEQIIGALNEKQQRYIHTISESGHHLLTLINDILDLAKIEAGQIKLDINKVDIHALCQSSLRMVKQLAQKKNQQVEIEIDDKLNLIWADERRLKQMLVNLLSNAVKFTAEGGKIGLAVQADEAENRVILTVWDSGIGIKESDLIYLFQPFVQLDAGLARESPGTGLGLALVAQMARLHGGSVSATSQPGVGSRFAITLPWEPALASDTLSRMKITGKFRIVKPGSENNGQTILLVEDTEDVVMMLKDYLESAAYRVVTAQNGIEGIVQAKKFHPDLILMDVQMPGMDGLEATQKLRSQPEFQNTPIIALTAFAMQNDRERCLAAGMNEYISKPVNMKSLLKIIQSFLADS